MTTIDILRKTYDQIKQYPLFFFNKIEEGNNTTRSRESYWIPEACYVYKECRNIISLDNIRSTTGKVLLAVGRPLSSVNTQLEYVRLELVPFDSTNIEHVKLVLSKCLNKSYDSSDKYAARELLWMLNAYCIDIQILANAINSFEMKDLQSFFWNTLKYNSICLSVPKQRILQKYLTSKGIVSDLYYPQRLKEALSICFPNVDFSNENKNIFRLIRLAIWDDKYRNIEVTSNIEDLRNPTNFYLQIRKWLKDTEYIFNDFETLSNLFRLFSPKTQLLLTKRYFHSVRHGQTSFNVELLKTFRDNPYENWTVYYHCTMEPSKPINLTIPLLCDNILTFLSTNYTALQTINGTLDMAYAQCDKNSPEIEFGIKHIVPVCQGGATPNSRFPGFICIKTIYGIKDEAFQPESLIKIFKKFLSIFGSQIEENTCNNELTTQQQCQNRRQYICNQYISGRTNHIDKYRVALGGESDDDKRTILSFFTDIDFSSGSSIIIEPSLSIVAPQVSKQRVSTWLNQNFDTIHGVSIRFKSGEYKQLNDGWVRKKDINYNFNQVIRDFLMPSWCTIEPRQNAYIGCGVLSQETGFDEEYLNRNGFNNERVQRKENEFILTRIKSALYERLDVHPDNNGKFCIPYHEELLCKLKSDFYTNIEYENSTTFDDNNIGFLTKTNSKYDKYCAPKFDNEKNFLTQLPFMWCRGKECFKNSLANQTLGSCKSWTDYTLLHILEIIGHPQISETIAGNEASEVIRGFIGMINQASNLFKRSRCRECNHILFVIPGTNFNRYNRFQCQVPSCQEYGKTVYLSQCFHCKTGLIDSRDSAKCPNGWHICPKCLSCCDSNIYNKMADRYVRRGSPIPLRIRERMGHGHNDNGEFYCPRCGNVVIDLFDSQTGKSSKYCEHCNLFYENHSSFFT